MLSQVFSQQPGSSCVALQAAARILTRRSIAAAAHVAAAGDASLDDWLEQQVGYSRALVSHSADLAAGCFAGEDGSQQQQQGQPIREWQQQESIRWLRLAC
jgi:hypothetical protein